MKSLLSLPESAFGSIDALKDDLLHSCFERHEAYLNMQNFSKFLAIGKKGAGKTAIFKMMLDSKNKHYDVFTEGYNLNDYPWHYHNLQARIGVPDSEKYIQSWMYLQLIAISKILLNVDQAVPFDDESERCRKILHDFIEDSYGTTNPEIVNLFSPLRKLNISALSVELGKFGVKIPTEDVEMKNLPIMIQDINRTLQDAVLKCLHPDHKYYICFDELDIGFDLSENYFNQIIGLLRAARTFNLKAAEYGKKIAICIFLRDDIYDVLRFEDKRKFTASCVTRIEWDTERTSNTLKSLMNKRFASLLSENGENVEWEDVFDPKSINGRYTKYSYITEMTCLRPRDIIDYCNLILEAYKHREEKGVNNCFENVDIVTARSIYSRNLLEEFDDEVHKHLPNYEAYLDVIKKLGKSKFTYSEFESTYITHVFDDMDAESCLRNLYQFSIVGNYIIGGTRGGSQKVFKYKDARNELDLDLPIIVHPGLVPTLGIREK